ncbi:sialate O-acetylesterase [Psychrobacter sp. JB193]|uniref:sialate O-acetylesterase n=1 Tax=Psychrobacter sp. JB193 TaxID=2024406 RepID=UPI000BAADA7F|nr:sialate O-acetylesterase [Psychrobacter sp. JB193]PAT63915.1 hypothetical protein CIK80_02045 [Psychrobacter sp. JB193]
MAEPITLQRLIDASMDSESLEVVVNGDDSTDVETRLGGTYPTLAKAIKTILEQGTLNATLFKTKALMESSALVDDSYALVTDDAVADNNGYYQKQSSEWVFSGYNPSAQAKTYTDSAITTALDATSFETQTVDLEQLLTVTDDDYNILMTIDENLDANFDGIASNRIATKGMMIFEDDSATGAFPITDDFGNILSYYDDNGVFQYIGKGADNLIGADDRIETDIIHVSIYGQSLSLGLGATTVSTASESPNALVPNQGIEDGQQSSVKQGINALPLTSTSLVAFNPALNPNLKENPIYGATIHLQKALDARGSTSKILPSAHGYGATAIAGLSKGTINYNVGVAQSKRYREYASARGDSCLTQFMLWVQGEADISTGLSKDAYKTALNKLLDDYQTDINQSALKPIMLTYQVSSHTKRTPNSTPDIAYAQLECANENPYIKMVCATYPMTYYDGVHMVANSYKWMGAYFGKVIDWMLENKRTDWKPLQPEKVMRTGKVVTVIFHVPEGQLVLDTTMVTNPGNYGFTVKDALGNNLTISSVSLKGDNRVNIVLSAIPTSDVTVTYALGTTGADAGYNTGARGNLRDSDDTISNTLDENGNPYSLYNWCVLFSKKEGFSWVQ